MLGIAEEEIEKWDKVIQAILKISISIHIKNLQKRWRYKLGDGVMKMEWIVSLFCFFSDQF